MPSQARHISLFRMIALIVVTALWIAGVALPAAAQNSVPATAREAAKTPEGAARLAHPTRRPASPPRSEDAGPGRRLGLTPGTVYDNGPINGTVDAWTINFGFAVTNSFTVTSDSTITGFQFGAWEYPGDTPLSVDFLIGTSPFGGTPATVSLSSEYLFTNPDGFNVNQVTASGLNVVLGPGTYWLTLQNAVDTLDTPMYWDENSGPSLAEDNEFGTIPSESFSIQNDLPACYQSQGQLQTIFDLTQQQGGTDGPAGVVMDHAGNLYGTATYGGVNSAGFVYKLTHPSSWLLDPLFNFLGGYSGGQPTGVILGSNGSLYGGGEGGIQNCGSDGIQYCGVVFNLAPQPTACKSALCSWNDTVSYRFSSETDGSGVINVTASDQHGNLFGVTSTGGASDAGTVFELAPSGGGWTKTTLYSFTGGGYGKTPSQVIVGNDGNLYGVAAGGLMGDGVVFQLTPSGGQWTASLVHTFGSDAYGPANLVQDSAGNLYGTAGTNHPSNGVLFQVKKTGSGWSYSTYIVQHNEFDTLNNLTIDAGGNLYGTGSDGSMFAGSGGYKNPGSGDTHDGYIFKAWVASDGWHYQDINYLVATYFDSTGSLALDPSGRLYGTTTDCGTSNHGTVWQFTP